MSTGKTLEIAWVNQGTIKWEEWYTQRHGKRLEELPGLIDHISFANYDLKRNGCPIITVSDDKLEVKNIPEYMVGVAHPSSIDLVLQHIPYHLFVNWHSPLSQFLNNGLLVHPFCNISITVLSRRIQAKCPTNNHCNARVNV